MTRSQGAVQRKRFFCAAALCLFRCFHRRLLEASELQSEAQVYEYSVRGKKKRGNRFKCCASDAGCRQSNSPTRFSFVIPVAQNPSTLPTVLLSVCAHVQAGGENRIVGLRMQAQRPLANGDGKDRISHSQDEDGRRRKERRVDYKVMRRGDTTDREQE